MNSFERILGVAAGLRLTEADIGQFALDQIDQARILRWGLRLSLRRLRRVAAALSKLGKGRVLPFEMAQDVLQPVLDPPEIAAAVLAGGFQAFEQIGHALFEMGEGGRAVTTDLHAVD